MKADPVEADIGQERVEFSRLVSIDDLKPGEIERRFDADETECVALAERFGVLAVRDLKAEVTLRRKGRSDLIVLQGRLSAEVEQSCVVTLEPVGETVEEDFLLRFTLDPAKAAADSSEGSGGDVVIDPEADDPPEAAGPLGIDVGEAIAQQLSVAINPYPRAPGAGLDSAASSPASEGGAGGRRDEKIEKAADNNPFAVLKTLKSGKKDGDS